MVLESNIDKAILFVDADAYSRESEARKFSTGFTFCSNVAAPTFWKYCQETQI